MTPTPTKLPAHTKPHPKKCWRCTSLPQPPLLPPSNQPTRRKPLLLSRRSPPQPRRLRCIILIPCTTSVVAYYQDDGVGYAEVALYINGVVPKGSYRFTVAENEISVLWQRAIHKRCFDKKLLQGIMKD